MNAPRPRSTPARTTALVTTGLLVTLALLAGVAGPATAHNGQNCGLAGAGGFRVLEGECYTRPVPCNAFGCTLTCDPDPDGEHTFTHARNDASGGLVAFSPHAQCGFVYETVSFEPGLAIPGASYRFRLESATFACSGFTGDAEYEFFIYLDRSQYLYAPGTCNPNWGLVTLALPGDDLPIGRGTHRLDVYFNAGPWTGNIHLDNLDVSCSGSLLLLPLNC